MGEVIQPKLIEVLTVHITKNRKKWDSCAMMRAQPAQKIWPQIKGVEFRICLPFQIETRCGAQRSFSARIYPDDAWKIGSNIEEVTICEHMIDLVVDGRLVDVNTLARS